MLSRVLSGLRKRHRYQLGVLALLVVFQQGAWTRGIDTLLGGVPLVLLYHLLVCAVSTLFFWTLLRDGRDQGKDDFS